MPEQKQQQESISAGEGLTSEKQCRSSTIQDRSGKYLTGEKRFSANGQNIAQNCTTMRVVVTTQYRNQPPEEDLQPILREEVYTAVASLKKGKSTGDDNIPAELVQAGGRP